MPVKTLYSNTVPQDTAQTVRAIPAPEGCRKMQSRPTTYDKDGDGRWLQWVSAWQHPQTGLWTLETHQRFTAAALDDKNGDKNKITRQKKTIARNVPFFDALHYCAYEEVSRKAAGATVLTTNDDTEAHYANVAARANQPLDMQGLPHPAAYGEVLTDGMFDDDAYALAERTEGQTLKFETGNVALPQIVDFSTAGQMEQSTHQITLDKLLEKEQLKAAFDRAQKVVSGIRPTAEKDRPFTPLLPKMRKEVFSLSVQWNGDHRSEDTIHQYSYGGLALGTSVGVGVMLAGAPPFSMLIGVAAFSVIRSFAAVPSIYKKMNASMASANEKRALSRSLKALPDCGLKNDIMAYYRTAKAVYHFAKAADIIAEHGYGSRKYLKHAFNQVNKGAKIADLSDVETEQLRMMIAEKRYPKAEEFISKLDSMGKSLNEAFDAITKQIEEADSVPALEHKEEIPMDILAAQKSKTVVPK